MIYVLAGFGVFFLAALIVYLAFVKALVDVAIEAVTLDEDEDAS